MRASIISLLPIVLAVMVNPNVAPVPTAPSIDENGYYVVESGLSTDEITSVIQVYNHKSGETMVLEMNEYLQGVLRGEMNGSYPMEALKAQAVAARTYAYYLQAKEKTHPGGACVCTNHYCCQAWLEADENWTYYEKIRSAVEETQGIIITYEEQPILAMYFSASGGYTEDYTDVWGGEECVYLQSVPSKNEEAYNYFDTVFVQAFSNWTVLSELRSAGYAIRCDSARLIDSIENVVRSDTGRVISMDIDGVTISGTAIRECLGLRSTHFYFQKNTEGGINIVTVGFGHGVGMSQCGAAAMAEEGCDYKEILHHYYTDVELEWRAFR